MVRVRCILGLLVLLVVSAWTEAGVVRKSSAGGDDKDAGGPTATEQPEEGKNNLNQDGVDLNSAVAASHLRARRNVKSCDRRDCMWPKSTDGKVYIPYVIANHYSSQELQIIQKAVISFSSSTCIRFFPRTNQRDFLYIKSLDGCSSYVGRQGCAQIVSLSRRGCIHLGTVQHELLHVLGFSHEQCRSDRDQHIRVLLQNVAEGEGYNFDKANTLNQGTPYDYGSVMHYGRLAFSKDNHNPTMVAVPDPSAAFGTARQMSQSDIDRVNLLYCRN